MVRIVTGQVGAGKTEYCINDIKAIKSREPHRRCVMLVPSHYSHEAEKLMTDVFGGTGLNGIEVTSFEKLARELLTGTQHHLAAPGKQAVICRAVKETAAGLGSGFDGKLIAAVGRKDFAEVARSLISELHRYMITSDMLRDRASLLDDGTLKQKLLITAMLSDNYDSILADTEYIDSDEDLLRLANVIGSRFCDARIYVDRFDELLPQQFEVLRTVIDSGADITVTFNTDDSGVPFYYGTALAIRRITEYTPTETVHIQGGMRHIKNAPELKFLFETWRDRSKYTDRVDAAAVFEARDAYTEIEHTARCILDLVREDGYRYRDITMICGSGEEYEHIIEAVFDEYDIPYYSDQRYTVSEHPIAVQILSLFDIIENDWDYESVFSYLRAGFVYTKQDRTYRRLLPEDIDRLENYVLKYGIRGKSIWSRSWTEERSVLDRALDRKSKTDSDRIAALDAIRSTVAGPILAYYEASKNAKTVTENCVALYEFLESINLYEGLRAELLSAAMNRATADAQRLGQIWNLLLDILDQISTALGEFCVTRAEFAEYVRAAMSKCTIRTIPSGVDRVFIGTVEKNRSVNTPVMFAIGAVAGTFPSDTGAEGFLSDADREILSGMDIDLAPKSLLMAEKQYNNVYKTLSAVSEKLYISYPIQGTDGKACRRSRMVADICAKLKNIRCENDIGKDTMYLSTPAATLHRLLISRADNPLWRPVREWLGKRSEWSARLNAVERAKDKFARRDVVLDSGLAASLYSGQITYSPTHLNTYAQCPFRNFIQYGLGARERDEYELKPAETGTYAHDVIKRFCERVDSERGWDRITDEDCERYIGELVSSTTENIMKSDIRDKERIADILRRTGGAACRAAKTVCRSVRAGSFVPYKYEYPASAQLSENVKTGGVIDRIDICRSENGDEYRIVDYKTGTRFFKPSDIYEGIDMQPVIYALALRESERDAKISGMYYSTVKNNFVSMEENPTAGKFAAALGANTALNGITFVDTDEWGNIDMASADRVESEAAREEGSLFFGNGDIEICSKVQSRNTGDGLIDAVREKILEIDSGIRGGNIAISPYVSGGRSACAYCPYSEVCKFDEACMKKREANYSDDQVWQMLSKDGDQ